VRLLGRVQARVLGAIELVDAITGRRVLTPLAVRTRALRTVRNSHGVHAVVDADGLSEYAATFDLADLDVIPAPLSHPYDIEIADPAGHYLSRRARVHLPRDPDPAHRAQPDSVFLPLPLRVFRAPAAPVLPGWSILRASVYGVDAPLGEGDPVPADAPPLPWALITVTEPPAVPGDPARVLSRAMTDARGEALIGIPGLPRFTWDDDGEGEDETVIKPSCPIDVELAWDPRATAADWIPDPDTPEADIPDLKTATTSLEVVAGREHTQVFTIVI
jgi:hypothetical protein